MAYTINRTDGSIEATVPDGTVYDARSLKLIGRNFNGYGEFIAENFIQLLENYAHDSQPGNPMTGQTWFDTDASILRVYDGTTFKNIGTAPSQTTEPLTPVGGDIWYDTSTAQLKVYNSATLSYTLVGPLYSTATGIAGPVVTVILDDGSQPHTVTLMYSNDLVIAILSEDATFTPLTAITGFGDINPGIELASTINGFFTGTATNAALFDGELPAVFLRSDGPGSINGALAITNDGGLTVGASSNLKLTVQTGDVYITNDIQDAETFIQTKTSTGIKDVITLAIDGTEARARVAAPGAAVPGNDLDIANKKYVDDSVTGSVFPSGTLMLFQQTLAPTGWTKQTTHNNKALRVVSGTVGSGGNTAFTTVFGAGKSVGDHALSATQVPNHNHSASFAGVALPVHKHHTLGDITTQSVGPLGGGGGAINATSVTTEVSAGTPAGTVTVVGTTGGGGSHNHTLSMDLQYVDLIIASKD